MILINFKQFNDENKQIGTEYILHVLKLQDFYCASYVLLIDIGTYFDINYNDYKKL